jgi:hypothetical protein
VESALGGSNRRFLAKPVIEPSFGAWQPVEFLPSRETTIDLPYGRYAIRYGVLDTCQELRVSTRLGRGPRPIL